MQIGRYRVSLHDHGSFRLDGGAMFGAVPKVLWERWIPPDGRNRIPMATRSLIVEDGEGRKLIVDLGNGDKATDKIREIFDIPGGAYRPVPGVTDIVLTHLHFDHAGGISRQGPDGSLIPNYPNARHYVARANNENAQNPNIRERASYLRENWGVLAQVAATFTEDGEEIWPGLTLHQAHGHTKGLQWVKLTDAGQTVVFPSDLCPTSHHLPAHYTMGYDLCAETAMREKSDFLSRAAAGEWTLVFQHDPAVSMGRVAFDASGRATLRGASAD